jgi:hypothetical protein
MKSSLQGIGGMLKPPLAQAVHLALEGQQKPRFEYKILGKIIGILTTTGYGTWGTHCSGTHSHFERKHRRSRRLAFGNVLNGVES